MLKSEFTAQFKKDYKLALKRGLDSHKLETVVNLLCEEKPLPQKYKDHPLVDSRNYNGMRECHISPDWLLVYQVLKSELLLKLVRAGSHSDLF